MREARFNKMSGGLNASRFVVVSICLLGSLFLPNFKAVNASTNQKLSAFVICKNKKNVRTLRIFPDGTKADNCTVTYSKGAVEEIVGSNRSTTTCNSILKNIQFNLEAAKWSCRSVQTAEVTLGSEVSHQ